MFIKRWAAPAVKMPAGRSPGMEMAPRVQAILARELGVSPTGILMDQAGSWVLCGETKQPLNTAKEVPDHD